MNLVEQVKKNKIITSIIGVVALVVIGISIILISRPSAEEVVNDFETAILKGDTNTLEKLIKPDDKNMKITKEQLQQLVSYAKDNPNYLKGHIFLLKAQAAIDKKDENARAGNPLFTEYTDGEISKLGDFQIEKSGELFSSYKIYARPYYLEVSADEPNAEIKVSGQDGFKTKEGKLKKTYGPLMPGTYLIAGSKKYRYADVKAEQEVNLFNHDNHKDSIELNLKGNKIIVESSLENVAVFVNGKDTGEKASIYKEVTGLLGKQKQNEDENKFGPVSIDGSIEIYGVGTYPWGTSKSNPQKVDKNTTSIDVTPDPFESKDSRDKVVQTINDFARQRIQALVQQNASIITTATDNIVKDYIEDIQSDKDGGNYWKGNAVGTRIDFGKVTLTNENDQYQATIPVEFHNNDKHYYKYFSDNNESLEENFEEKELTLKFDQNRWIIAKVDDDYLISDDDYMNNNDIVKSDFK